MLLTIFLWTIMRCDMKWSLLMNLRSTACVFSYNQMHIRSSLNLNLTTLRKFIIYVKYIKYKLHFVKSFRHVLSAK